MKTIKTAQYEINKEWLQSLFSAWDEVFQGDPPSTEVRDYLQVIPPSIHQPSQPHGGELPDAFFEYKNEYEQGFQNLLNNIAGVEADGGYAYPQVTSKKIVQVKNLAEQNYSVRLD